MSKLNNFRTASVQTVDEVTARLASLQTGFEQIMAEGGVSAVKADPVFQMKAAKLLRESVTDLYSFWNPLPSFVERKTANIGDKVEMTGLTGQFRVVKYAPGSHPLIQTPRTYKYSLATSQWELAFGVHLYRVMERQITIADHAKFAAEAMVRHDVEMLFKVVNAACHAAATDLKGRALRTELSGDITQVALDDALKRMGQYNSGVTIFGSHYALHKIFEFAGAQGGDATKEDLIRRGQIGAYKGAKLVKVDNDYNIYSGQFPSFDGIDFENVIILAGATPGATYLERDISALNWEDLVAERAEFRTGLRKDAGITVHSPHRFHLFQLNKS